MQFKKENFDGDLVTIHLKINILEDNRKILRELDIYNEKNELTVKINSNGGFLDLNKRKIVEPPKEILDNCIKYLKEQFYHKYLNRNLTLLEDTSSLTFYLLNCRSTFIKTLDPEGQNNWVLRYKILDPFLRPLQKNPRFLG